MTGKIFFCRLDGSRREAEGKSAGDRVGIGSVTAFRVKGQFPRDVLGSWPK